MEDTIDVADEGTKDITKYLKSLETTLEVINIEKLKKYQGKDIDLLLVTDKRGDPEIVKIEIKVDRYYKTGNYFFEVNSCIERDTKGCFLYTECDYLFYYFLGTGELHVLPMPTTREWFLKEKHRFRETCSTESKLSKNKSYHSKGILVPRNVVRQEVKGIKIIKIK